MTTGRSYTYKLFARNDFSAFWALFTDNLINLIVLSGICQFVFNMPADIVFGRIVPGAAVAILAGIAVYTWMAKHIAEKEGRDVTALPLWHLDARHVRLSVRRDRADLLVHQ